MTSWAATPASTTRLRSWNTAGTGAIRGAGRTSTTGIAPRFISSAELPLGSPDRSTTAGCSCPACPTTRPSRTISAHRPGCHGRCWAGRSVTCTPAARAITRAASKASAASTGRPGPHGPRGSRSPHSTAPTCTGWCGSDASSRTISSSVGRRWVGISSTARVCSVGCTTWAMANSATSPNPRETLRDNASSNAGSSVVARSGRSASSGFSTAVVLRRGSSAGSPH